MARTYDFRSSLAAGASVRTTLGASLTVDTSGARVASSDLDPPAFQLTDSTLSQETVSNQWLVFRSSASAGGYGGVYFGSAAADQEYSFPIRGDGRMHTYNIWLGDNFLIPRQQSDLEAAADPATTNQFPGNQYKLVNQLSKIGANGLASPVTIFPTFEPGASGVVELIRISDRPEGPALLIAEWVGPGRAMNRVNTPNTWGIRLRNAGGIAATDIRLAFSSTSGLSVAPASLRCLPDAIPPDEDRTIYFDVVATTANAWGTLTVTATCAQDDSVTASGRAWIDPPLSGVPRNVIPTPTAIPRTQKPYLVGVWYFPGWENNKNQVVSIVSSFERRPELGFLDQTSVAVSSWEILWAVNHGIDYFLVEWIDSNGLCPPYLAGLLASPYISSIKFQLSYINHGGTELSSTRVSGFSLLSGGGAPAASLGANNDFYRDTANNRLYGPKLNGAWSGFLSLSAGASSGTVTYTANFLNLIRRWTPYFQHASYLRTSDNRPRVNLFGVKNVYDQLNDIDPANDASRYTTDRDQYMARVLVRATDIVRAMDSRIPGLSWDGEVQKNQGGGSSPTRFSDMGFERSSNYNWAGCSTPANVVSAEAHRNYGESTLWDRQTNGGMLPMLSVSCGFEHRRWLSTRNASWMVVGWTYEQMRAHLQAAKAWLDRNVAAGSREILLEAWNEYGEGSVLAPAGWNQFQFLKAVRETLAPTATPWPPVTPRDVGLSVPQVTGLFRWAVFPTACPDDDNNAVIEQGITIVPGSSPCITPSHCSRSLVRYVRSRS